MKTIDIEIEGTSPLLQHAMPQETLMGLLGVKAAKIKPIEEMTPREIAERHAYKSKDGKFVIPMEYIAGAFQFAASDYKQKNSSRKTMKGIAKGIFRPTSEFAPLFDEKGKPMDTFEVDIRKATNHQKGAVAVCRPRFDKWKCKFTVMIDDTLVAPQTCNAILTDAGKRSGIGSYRVSRGGYFGQFMITNWKEI